MTLINATVAQLVEHLLAKEEVAGSSPVCRSLEGLRTSLLAGSGAFFIASFWPRRHNRKILTEKVENHQTLRKDFILLCGVLFPQLLADALVLFLVEDIVLLVQEVGELE